MPPVTIVLKVMYSSMPYLLPSRPIPEYLTPPNLGTVSLLQQVWVESTYGAAASDMTPVLIATMPASNLSETRRDRLRSVVIK